MTLPIFPDGSSASTVTTTIWVGLLVVVWTNLRFGWTLSGLVVPGYLVPLLFVRPVSVVAILAEAVATYLVVYALSETFRRRDCWCSLFGRDRFFALVLVSVLVRVACDGYLFPRLGEAINDAFGLQFNYQDQLHSVGLVIVALIANYFWKPGLCRGVGPLAATTLATFLLVRYVLIPYTTFDIASLRYVYEDIASSLLASPKAYILLLTTALAASHMNLRYAWEYNGILIPALIGLQWCEPLKIVTTLIEAVVILAISSLVLRTPWLRKVNIQGGRKIAIFFTVAFCYRLALAWFSRWYLPEWKATDLHGFGYLLSTLLANRFHERGHLVRISMATVKVSFWGAMVGSVIGYAFLFAPEIWPNFGQQEAARGAPVGADGQLVEVLRADKVRLYQQRLLPTPVTTNLAEVDRFIRALGDLLAAAPEARDQALRQANRRLRTMGMEAFLVEGRYVYVRDDDLSRGRGLYVLNLDQPLGLLVSVPHPLHEPFSMEAGLCLFRDLDAGVLAVAGVNPVAPSEAATFVEDRSRMLFHAVHRELGKGRTLQVRGYRDPLSVLPNTRQAQERAALADQGESQLWISGGLPRGYDLQQLSRLVGKIDLQWTDSPGMDTVRGLTRPGFAALYLSRQVRTSLFSRLVVSAPRDRAPETDDHTARIVSRLLDEALSIAPAGSETYVPARQEELMMLDQEVLQPLLTMLREADLSREQCLCRLQLVNASAAALNYVVTPFTDGQRGTRYLILEERQPKRRHWGTYVFCEDAAAPNVWEIPHPILELNSLEFGVQQFVQSRGAALLIAGAHMRANRDGSSDVARFSNKFTFFNLVHQALLREWSGTPGLVAQVRAIKDPVDVDLVVATDDGASRQDELTPLKSQLLSQLSARNLRVGFVDGGPELSGYELGNSAQWEAMSSAVGIEFVSLWLSPSLRWQYRQQTENDSLLSAMSALGIRTIEVDLAEYLYRQAERAGLGDQAASLFDAETDEAVEAAAAARVEELLLDYLERRDVVVLQSLQGLAGVRLEAAIDVESRQAFLLVYRDRDAWNQPMNYSRSRIRQNLDVRVEPKSVDFGYVQRQPSFFGRSWPLVANLAELRAEGPTTFTVDRIDADGLRQFVAAHATWLVWRRTAK